MAILRVSRMVLRSNVDINGNKLFQVLRNHANHRIGFIVQHDLLPENAYITTETFLPRGVSQHCHIRRPGPVFAGNKSTSQHGRSAEQGKEIIGYKTADDTIRPFASGEV